jgi:hypothetical protein
MPWRRNGAARHGRKHSGIMTTVIPRPRRPMFSRMFRSAALACLLAAGTNALAADAQ